MTENNFSRGMLLGTVTLMHALVLGAVVILAMNKYVEPPVVPPMVLTMLLPSDAPQQPQVQPKSEQQPAPPKPREIPPEVPVIEHVEPLTEPVPVARDPVPEPIVVTPPAPPVAVAAPVVTAPPPPPAPVAPPEPLIAPRFDAAYLNNPAPVYPALAKRKGEQGAVMLRVGVSAEGKPQEVLLHKSSGSPALDKAAIAAVRQWIFVPAKRGGEAVAAWVQVPIVFQFNK